MFVAKKKIKNPTITKFCHFIRQLHLHCAGFLSPHIFSLIPVLLWLDERDARFILLLPYGFPHPTQAARTAIKGVAKGLRSGRQERRQRDGVFFLEPY
jgi:hypothetical protein